MNAVRGGKRVTVTLPKEVVAVLESMKERDKMTASEVIAGLLRRAWRTQVEQEMAEGYRSTAEESKVEAEQCFEAQAEVILGAES